MFETLPKSAFDVMQWEWTNYEPFVNELLAFELTADNVDQWLRAWTQVYSLIGETYSRLYVQRTIDTTDAEIEKRFLHYAEYVIPPAQIAEQKLKEKLLASGFEPAGFELPLKRMRVAAEIFREANVTLEVEETKLSTEYDKIIGAQSVMWNGQEYTLAQIEPLLKNPDRDVREQIWRLAMERRSQDRPALNELWVKFLEMRRQMAKNAGEPDYRSLRWKQFNRFDYTPQDCESFHAAIEEVVVPAVKRLNEKKRQQAGYDQLRPWDFGFRDSGFDPLGRAPLQPFKDVGELAGKAVGIFSHLDEQFSDWFDILQKENQLDLANRKGKAPGGYQTYFPVSKLPFIFMNAVGSHDDVQTLLHEAGHAFHAFESANLPYMQQSEYSAEMAEVASMSMELLAAPYLSRELGGYYSPQEAARARIEHLEGMLVFWPYMAVVDAFQHWVYTHVDEAIDPANCDAKWGELWDRFKPGVDWTGLEDVKVTGWHRKLHIFEIPFYYVDYGLAQLGATQVWANSVRDQAGAVASYRRALALGGTVSIPEFFEAAGAKFVFDADNMRPLVDMIEDQLHNLEAVTA